MDGHGGLLQEMEEGGVMARTHNSKFTFDEHKKLGDVLKNIDTQLVDVYTDVALVYGKDSRVAIAAIRAWDAVGTLRHILDDQIFNDHAARDTQELTHVYYGERSGKGWKE